MTETAKNNLKLARSAIGKNEFKNASVYYEQVHKEQPENLEAEWFYLFGVLVADHVTKDTAKNYKRLAEIFYPTLEYIATFEEGEEKQSLVFAMITGFPPLKDIVYQAMIQLLVKDSSAIPAEDMATVLVAPDVDKKRLADKILTIFGDGEPYCLMAANIWKALIAERFKQCEYRNFQDRGKELWFDELAKKIKKYDPSYEMPQFKQAGCISTGAAARAPIGR